MAYRVNPFLERRSERGTTDQEFVRLFSPKVLEALSGQNCLAPGLHLFKSPPGGGKTTILRCLTPSALRSFWEDRVAQNESFDALATLGALDDEGPQVLGVMLSCAAGYADLPPGASAINDAVFRALFDCRVVLRTVRAVMDLVGNGSDATIEDLTISYSDRLGEPLSIPQFEVVQDLVLWAEGREREILDRVEDAGEYAFADVRFDAVLWLQSVTFSYRGKTILQRRLLMIDDVHKLRRHQRDVLVDELAVLRPSIPIWLAARSIAFADEFLSQGSRVGRDIHDHALDDLWTPQAFSQFGANVLERRFEQQSEVPRAEFASYLSETVDPDVLRDAFSRAVEVFDYRTSSLRNNIRYSDWITSIPAGVENPELETVINVFAVYVLIARDLGNRQLSLELSPLSEEELRARDNSQVRAAAELFAHRELRLPYYFGLQRLLTMATGNIEELLALAASLYDGMRAKQAIRPSQRPMLSPADQEKRLSAAIEKRANFIPSSHREGRRALRLLDSIGAFCRERTYLANAPYAPGVTGVRLSVSEKLRLEGSEGGLVKEEALLKRVLAECVAENLLVTKDSQASTSRDAGTVFYLSRSLCAHHDLPLQYGGWQEVTTSRLVEWMERGYQPTRTLDLGVLE